MTEAVVPVEVTRVRGDTEAIAADHVVAEEPMELRLGGVPIAVVMRTPGDDEDLALGFALTEGIILDPGELAAVTGSEGRYELVLAPGVEVDPEQFRRNFYASSSCGVCGKASIDAVRVTARPIRAPARVPSDVILDLPRTMRPSQAAFETTGGIHAAAIFDLEGGLLDLYEDVGRHNAVDKVVGSCSRRRWPLDDTILMVSGRVSFEITQKAGVAGIPVVCGVSAPSSLAIELGRELGMTVIGFVRDDGYNLYT
ncbi:MAG: formate dehydrogenase accessory sulfurtransferase FdhD [Acidimicrobiia bacterium]|nr:formate dehydrogenase accessory sulfurtransferase FdhD [Acidimicrobiia bacterium]